MTKMTVLEKEKRAIAAWAEADEAEKVWIKAKRAAEKAEKAWRALSQEAARWTPPVMWDNMGTVDSVV